MSSTPPTSHQPQNGEQSQQIAQQNESKRSHGFPATYPAALTSEYSTNYLHTNHGYPLKSSGHEEAKQQHQTYQYEVQPNEYPYAYYYTGHTSPQTIHPKQQAEQQDHTTQHQTQPHHQMNPSQLSSVGSQHQQIQSQLQENIPHNQVSSSTSTRPSVSQQPQQQEYAYYSQDNPLELLVSSATSSFTHTSQGSGTTPKSGTVYTGGPQQANLQGASAPGYAVGPRFQNQGPTLHQHSENLGTNTIGTSQMSDLQRHYAMKQMGIPQGYSSHYYPVASKAMQNELVSPIQAIQTQQQNHQHHHHHQQQQQQKQMGQGFDPSSIVFHPIEPVAQWKQLQVPQPIGYLQSAQRFFDPFQLPSGLTLLSPRNQTGLISSGGISTTTGVMVLPFQSSGTTDSSGEIGTEASHQLQQQQQHSQQQPNSPLNELCSLCQCGDCDRLAAPCQHPFHHICLKNFLQRSNNCPTCTKPIVAMQIYIRPENTSSLQSSDTALSTPASIPLGSSTKMSWIQSKGLIPGSMTSVASLSPTDLTGEEKQEPFAEGALEPSSAAEKSSNSKRKTSKPKSSTTKRRKRSHKVCSIPGCSSTVRSRGLCKGHGGGRRCRAEGCGLSDQGGGYCISHGGGRRCQFEGCESSAQSRGLCKLHGGGSRCQVENCTKSSQGKTGLCRAHGGGRRCRVEGCNKTDRRGGYCVVHGADRKCLVEDCSRTGKIRNLCAKHFYATPEGQSVSIYQQEAAAAVAVTASSSGGSRRKSKSTDPPSSGGPTTS